MVLDHPQPIKGENTILSAVRNIKPEHLKAVNSKLSSRISELKQTVTRNEKCKLISNYQCLRTRREMKR